ncbi:hypothetical protein [Duganella rhizosphaerae]
MNQAIPGDTVMLPTDMERQQIFLSHETSLPPSEYQTAATSASVQ